MTKTTKKMTKATRTTTKTRRIPDIQDDQEDIDNDQDLGYYIFSEEIILSTLVLAGASLDLPCKLPPERLG